MIEKNFSNQTYRKHQEKLFELVRMPIVTEDTVQEATRYMCEIVADMLAVDTVSIWHFDSSYRSISCQVAYSHEKGTHYPKLTIHRNLAPDYFDALQKDRVLAIEDVRNHPCVKELYTDYFVEGQRIRSMLDAPIYANNRVKGVICCETFLPREWTYLEELIISTLTDFISILYFRLDRQAVETHIRRLAYIDELTGLLKDTGFIEKMDEERQLQPQQLGALVYLKVDDFRSIEDAIGIEKSDEIVREVANRLRRYVDESNLSRMSQSGFAIWLPYGDRIKLNAVADELCEVLVRDPFLVDELEVILTMSAFIAVEQKDITTLEMVHRTRIAASERAFQRAAIVFYEEEMGTKAANRLILEMNLRSGLAGNEFMLYYQPKIDATTGALRGFEGLMRWNHPERGLIPPLDFIPLAESTGVIIDLEEWVFVTACRQLKRWHDRGDRYSLALNLSARHFLSEGVVEKFAQIAREEGVSTSYLTLEITESVGMENQQHVIDRFVAFREEGFSISIDDFGTGFSAFVYLKHYPIHEIKIDRQFIQVTENDPTGNVIVESIVDLARGLNLKTVCEGIETIEQWHALRELGCDEMQGYYFSKPLPLEELETWIDHYMTQKRDA
ncbi:GGDEF and EAL domain-containing protein [Exiguobacterium sp. MMG028]|uniref:sensor domain-containing phosphodiesterase n=1 Tax=Exiguobacterium sp. MMG028 TaxID=3021979 RepID=UPI0022FDE2F8|nr:GGDEF and EAL domain-containing protein [Exiguobacterium sp. MMG028]MDA5560788.1 GGDEF and EAL domain-containing protein [Exiguobacterium sp. MMG028]